MYCWYGRPAGGISTYSSIFHAFVPNRCGACIRLSPQTLWSVTMRFISRLTRPVPSPPNHPRFKVCHLQVSAFCRLLVVVLSWGPTLVLLLLNASLLLASTALTGYPCSGPSLSRPPPPLVRCTTAVPRLSLTWPQRCPASAQRLSFLLASTALAGCRCCLPSLCRHRRYYVRHPMSYAVSLSLSLLAAT